MASDETVAIVLATVINQDGRSSSLTAPNGPAQSKLIGKALIYGKIYPGTVAMVAVHGTGWWSFSWLSKEDLYGGNS